VSILDSNIWIDILVFDDPVSRPIVAARLSPGRLRALIDARCLAELTYVLDYPQFAHRAIDREQALGPRERAVAAAGVGRAGHSSGIAQVPGPGRPEVSGTGASGTRPTGWCRKGPGSAQIVAAAPPAIFGFKIGVPASFVAACGSAASAGVVSTAHLRVQQKLRLDYNRHSAGSPLLTQP